MAKPASRRFVVGAGLLAAGAARIGALTASGGAADPYAGAPVIGDGARTTVLDVTDPAFGAKGDAVLLGDLVVTAGSATVSSATAPFRSTELDRGKAVVWRTTSDTVGRGVVESVQSATSATLRSPAASSARSDGGPNTNGAVGTDDTAALDRAFDAAQAAAREVAAVRVRQVPAVQVHVPRGVFLFTALKAFEQPGVSVTGEGRFSSILASADEGPWLQLGTYDSAPPDAYQGTATDWRFQDLHFINPVFRSGSSEGRRTGRAVQDNGSGAVQLLGCMFTGMEVGFCGAYGSDFTTVRDCFFYLCDTGYYFGPGSQQLDIAKTDASQCREGAVFEGAPQWHLGNASSFEDPSVAAITIEASSSGTTRYGLPVTVQGAFYAGTFLVDGATWFETNSGGNGRSAPRLVWMHGDGPFGLPAEGLVVRDAYVVAGGSATAGGRNSFVEYDSALVSDEPVVIDGLKIGGELLNAVFRMSGTATTSKPRISGVQAPASVALTLGRADGAKIAERDGSFRWAARLQSPTAAASALQLVLPGDGNGEDAAPVVAAVRSSGDDVVSGIAAGGAILDAFAAAETAGGTVAVDPSRCNLFSCTLTGGSATLRIGDGPAAASQRLVIEAVSDGTARSVQWAGNVRFAGGAGPTSVAAGTATAVTLVWHPARKTWIESARSEGVRV